MALKKGVLIVIEGIDGSGKSTQARMLLRKLASRGYKAVLFREPSDSVYGREIKRKALRSGSLSPEEELDLFQRDRKENVEKNLKPAMKEGKAVILDRYYFSTIAYQGARGLDREWIRKTNEEFAVRPDLVFILDIEPRAGLERIEKRRKKDRLFEQKGYLEKVRKIFQGFRGKSIIHIDARRSPDAVSQKIEKAVFKLLVKIPEI